MGEFDEDPAPLLLAPPSRESAAALSLAAARRRRRRAATRENVRRVSAQRSPRTARLLAELWDSGAQDSRRLAERYRAILETTHDPLAPGELSRDAVAMEELHLSLAMRCTRNQAASMIREAHRIGTLLPLSLTRLGRGEFPVAWFEKLLERTRGLEDDALRVLDVELSGIDLAVAPEAFSRRLGHLLTAAISRSRVREDARPENRRRVVMDPPRPDGTGCLRIIGPLPEILDLARRLDRSAHAVQDAQRSAFLQGTPLPVDPGGFVEATGSIPPLARACYDILMSTRLETAGIEVPAPRFRMNVTVPMLTLLGESDAPGMLDGTTPIPAQMARELAGGEDTWYRILTDATTGSYLPVPADRYRPTAEQLAHLLLRHPTCAVPGCARPSSLLSEADHIEEFDHERPTEGGSTEVSNLHQLCREHHRLKTLGLIDPVRDDEAGTTWWDASGLLMSMQEDGRELATDQVVAEMTAAWEQYEGGRLMRAAAASRRHRVAEQGLAPGDECTGPDGEEGWWVGHDGDLHPPGDPPPY
ncbi:HNH endonuclease [Brachybacterium vulturis]|uniref:HNH endonuclease n=1 Tax=Brachybacterium vulturis TaxID=2017484 RepID=A0A291GMB8_9MICO|nr:HNH endonuclease signature motif containing protein [Brachybacterium vulturis]ATG51479.1 HNH endonuclease [Brachybacterium vulturis]